MPEAYLIDAVRTPIGRRGGGLSTVHPADLGAHVITALFDRTNADPSEVDDVIFGCVDTVGAQAGDIARTAWLVAGYPEQVPGVTVDRQCGSSQQALQFAAQAVLSGMADLVVAGGVQSMSRVPIGSAMTVGEQFGDPTPTVNSPGWAHRYGDEELSQFRAADHIALRWDIGRAEMEEFALTSHQRALAARTEGRFDCEIVGLAGVEDDECPRADTSLERMAGLKPLREGGRITAGLSSQLADGASAVLVASAEAVRRYRLEPRARVVHASARGADPVAMLTAPIRATRYALRRAGMGVDEVDLFEVNEAFASVVLAWMRELGVSGERVNVNGGAIALGHPIGASGTRMTATLLNELERGGGRVGLQTMCEGGGQANVTIIERVG